MQNLPQDTKPNSPPEKLQQMMEDVLSLTKKNGIQDAQVMVHHDEGFSVDVRMGETETVSFSDEQGVSVTVYHQNRKGSASSSDTSPSALQDMVIHAIGIAKASAQDPCFGLPDLEEVVFKYPELNLYHPWDIQPDEAQNVAISCEDQARARDERIHNSDGANLSTYAFTRGYANTHGFNGLTRSTRHSLVCSLLAKDGQQEMQRDYAYTTARDHVDLMSTQSLAALVADRTIAKLSPQKIKTQKAPVIFSSRISSDLFSSFISAISGGLLYQKKSFLVDALGDKILPDFIQVFEVPHQMKGLGSASFDTEGILTRPNHFVENGILTQYVLGSYSARRLNLKTTANAGGVHNLKIPATAGDLGDLLKAMNRGLLVTELMGQGVNLLTGDYSRGAGGFWVEDGKIQHPVDGITIAGNLKDMFLGIEAIGNDIQYEISTDCGSVWINQMMIAGT